MTTDSAAADGLSLPLPNEALATLMASPEFQAQLAALAQQAAVQLRALVELLRTLEGKLAPAPFVPLPSGFGDEDTTPVGIWLPPPDPVLLPPKPKPVVQEGVGVIMPSDMFPLARLAVMKDTPTLEPRDLVADEVAVDMLAMLPVVLEPEPDQPGATGGAAEEPGFRDGCWLNAGEGGLF